MENVIFESLAQSVVFLSNLKDFQKHSRSNGFVAIVEKLLFAVNCLGSAQKVLEKAVGSAIAEICRQSQVHLGATNEISLLNNKNRKFPLDFAACFIQLLFGN